MLYIRTDMNKTIATGHVMRCLSIADAARQIGEETTFLLADEQASELLEIRGYPYIILHTLWNEMELELSALKETVRRHSIKRMLVDSYSVTRHYLESLSEVTEVYYLDDLNAFCYPVKGIICYANYWEKFDYPGQYQDAKLYLGPKYVPLRREFCTVEKKQIKEKAENLLLMSGGTDPYDILIKILNRLDKTMFQSIDVICGVYHANYETLQEQFGAYPNISIQKAVSDPERYMRKADLAVSAGGTALYELCAVGTPAISYSMADNQLDNVKKFQEDGVIAYAGDIRSGDAVSAILWLVEQYRGDRKLRYDCSRKMLALVDGKGAERIARALLEGKEQQHEICLDLL